MARILWRRMAGGMLFWGSVVCLIAWGIHRSTRRSDEFHRYGRSPLDHLKQRYAKGEITKEQYEEIKRDLMG